SCCARAPDRRSRDHAVAGHRRRRGAPGREGRMLEKLTRRGRVLGLFTPERHEWGVTAVAVELGIAKSQAHELLASLCEIGLLHRERGRYPLRRGGGGV